MSRESGGIIQPRAAARAISHRSEFRRDETTSACDLDSSCEMPKKPTAANHLCSEFPAALFLL